MKNSRFVFIALLLLGISIFSAFKYISSLKEKNDLLRALEEVKAQVLNLQQGLDKEKDLKQQAVQEGLVLKESLKLSQEEVVRFDADLSRVQNIIEELDSQFSILRAENTALRGEQGILKSQLIQLKQDNEAFSARLNSLAGLKKAIGELKIKMRQAKAQIRQKVSTGLILEGNDGFVVRNGKSTYLSQVKIEVNPVPVKE